MRALAAGFGAAADDLLEPLPPLSGPAQLAVDCWLWCDGWAPERWPAFDAFHQVDDWPALVQLMHVIRKQLQQAPVPTVPPPEPT